MSEKVKLTIKQIFNLAFNYQKHNNFKLAKNLYKKIIEVDPKILNVQFNLGLVYEQLGEYDSAMECYQKTIEINPKFENSYNNLGLIFRKLGNKKKAIEVFSKLLKINPEYTKTYNNLGLIYADLGKYKEAIENYIITLRYDLKNPSAIENLIHALTFYSPDIDHPLIKANNELKKLNYNQSFEDLLNNKNLDYYFKKIYKILFNIQDTIKNINFNFTQVYRKNEKDLNCERHHRIFNKSNIIPKFCFGCFKIQIEPVNVLELIKLFLIFDKLELSKNNLRKCMVELREKIPGTYKGLIYCDSLKEAEKIILEIDPLLKANLKYKINIKRGCTEFYKPYSNFQIIKENQKDFMYYKKEWEKIEIDSDLNEKYIEKIQVSTIRGLSVSDILIINQWINYAILIGDKSYLKVGLKTFQSDFINNKMSQQTEFRRNQFIC